jgi:predicted dehydrogenase
MRVGVVGCGYWGSKHVRVLQGLPEVDEVVAIDQNEERLLSLKGSFPGLALSSNLADALGDMDAVIIATPPKTHAQLALAAISAGKGVLVEKPLATSTGEARRLVEEAAHRAVSLGVGHTFEHNAAVWKLRELIQNGDLGRLHYLDSARLNLGLYQSDVNVLWDLAPHDISIFNFILGATPTSVQAWGSRHAHQSLEDVAYLRLIYEEPDVIANVHVSWLDPCKVRRVTAVGSKTMVVYNDLSTDERIRIFDKGVLPGEQKDGMQLMPMTYRYGEIRSPNVPFTEPLAVQDQDFVRSVIEGRQPLTDGQNGLAVVQVLECADASLRERRPVFLDEHEALGDSAPELAVAN